VGKPSPHSSLLANYNIIGLQAMCSLGIWTVGRSSATFWPLPAILLRGGSVLPGTQRRVRSRFGGISQFLHRLNQGKLTGLEKHSEGQRTFWRSRSRSTRFADDLAVRFERFHPRQNRRPARISRH